VIIHIFNEQNDLTINEHKIKPLVLFVLDHFNKTFDECSLYFIDEERITLMHDQFFNKKTPTDCISFPMDTGDEPHYKILGEVFVCPLIAKKYAKAHGVDVYTELSTYVVHGLLHLLGYKDHEKQLKKMMDQKQDELIESLKIKNLLLSKK
jgi:probable rRNA maturation factor